MAYRKDSKVMYSWKPGYRAAVSAEVAGTRISQLSARAERGIVTPRMVVEDARPEDSPLHPAFEWRDDVAAEKYREEQARAMLRSIVITVPTQKEEEPKVIRAFERVELRLPSDQPETDQPEEDDKGDGSDESDSNGIRIESMRGYVSTLAALQDDVFRRQIIERALRDMHAYVEKYKSYRDICSEFDEAVNLAGRSEQILTTAIERMHEQDRQVL